MARRKAQAGGRPSNRNDNNNREGRENVQKNTEEIEYEDQVSAPAAAVTEDKSTGSSSSLSEREVNTLRSTEEKKKGGGAGAALEWLLMLILLLYSGYLIHGFQSETLPAPVSQGRAGVRGFSEETALEHVGFLQEFGPHPVGSDALLKALMFVYSQLIEIKNSADPYVDFEVDMFEPGPGVERLKGGLFYGKSFVYTNLKHLVVRVSPGGGFEEAKENAILVSSHVDTVITSPGAGDCSSCVAVMLELLRALSHWASGFKHSVIFLFNTGEEEGLIGAHSFITQHRWSSTIRAAIDVESMGTGGRSTLFQAGPSPWLLKLYASVAKYPAAQIVAQDVFHYGIVKSATDFQVYREVGGLSGLDFAFLENSGVYHTKNDKMELLRPGSLQHIGDDLLALLKEAALSDELEFQRTNYSGFEKMETVYFDILGKWMITYPLSASKVHQTSLLAQGSALLFASLYLSGYRGFVEFGLSLLTVGFTWVFAIAYAVIVAGILPELTPFPISYIANPWLVIGLFGAPAVFGALLGHGLGRVILMSYIEKREQYEENVKWLAERWLFKAGIFQWVIVLALGTWVQAGSAYIALFWIVPATAAYGLFEAKFSPQQRLRGLMRGTLWLGTAPGVLITTVPVVRLTAVLVGNLVRIDRIPGGMSAWSGNAMTGVLVASFCCLMLGYLLPYAHRSGGLSLILAALTAVFFGTVLLVLTHVVPAFTEDTGRGFQAVHVVDTTGQFSTVEHPGQFISLFSSTPGKFEKELIPLKDEGFVCGEKSVDFVSFDVKYGCVKPLDEDGALAAEQPSLKIEKDRFFREQRVTSVRFNSGLAYRWNLLINTTAIEGFKLRGTVRKDGEEKVLVPRGAIVGVDGWHNVQFTTDNDGPGDFLLTLYWHLDSQGETDLKVGVETLLLKLRTDVDEVTPKLDLVLNKLPDWCVLFGKSTMPYPLVYLAHLKVPVPS